MTRQDLPVAVTHWLRQFEQALTGDGGSLAELFHADSHWRDVLALTWRIHTFSGCEAVVRALQAKGNAQASHIEIDPDRTPPRRVTRAGRECIEAIFRFETADGGGDGVVRLTADGNGVLKAWTLLTALEELKGHEEQVGRARPH